jgi:hypothetical protein
MNVYQKVYMGSKYLLLARGIPKIHKVNPLGFKVLPEPLKFLETKNWSIAVRAACVKKNVFFFFNIFFWTSELHIS